MIRVQLIVLLALMTFGSSPIAGEVIILDASNSFTDELEPGARIDQPGIGSGATPGEGPIVGVGVVFACGTSDVADFSVYTGQLGGPGANTIPPCADRPKDIVSLDQKLTAKALTSGNLYNIDLLSFRDAQTCVDGILVPGCTESNGATSYLRDQSIFGSEIACNGFFAPMAAHPVRAKKNRVFPLKLELIDGDGIELSDTSLSAPPVVEVMLSGTLGEGATDVSSDVLAAGTGTEGNQFEFTEEGVWQFNLKSQNFSAPGTYLVTIVSGDETDYLIDPACFTSFVID